MDYFHLLERDRDIVHCSGVSIVDFEQVIADATEEIFAQKRHTCFFGTFSFVLDIHGIYADLIKSCGQKFQKKF